MGEKTKIIPRKIWILWFQGLVAAPYVVKKCVDSWTNRNPTWDVIILDHTNISDFVTLDLHHEKITRISPAHQSDLIRLHLLSNHGGVWADATTFCTIPLDGWIEEYTTSGFFCFYRPGRDRVMSNWFMVAEKECPIVVKLKNSLSLFWNENDFGNPTKLKNKISRKLEKIFNRNEESTKYWFNPVVTKVLKVYPYFVFHYMFKVLVDTDPECQSIWHNTKKYSADLPHHIQTNGLFSNINSNNEWIRNEIDEKRVPLYKLTYKYDHNSYSSDSLLYYLIEKS